ncbi:MAG: phage holin family protein [Verrucomicrobiota bacterium]
MNPKPDTDTPSQPQLSDRGTGPESFNRPATWREAALALMTARISLIQIESKDAAENLARRLLLWTIVGICAFFTWALILAGGIASIAENSHYPWYWIALVCAAIHLLIALIVAIMAKKSVPPAFPVTRSEFQKDREWILKL